MSVLLLIELSHDLNLLSQNNPPTQLDKCFCVCQNAPNVYQKIFYFKVESLYHGVTSVADIIDSIQVKRQWLLVYLYNLHADACMAVKSPIAAFLFITTLLYYLSLFIRRGMFRSRNNISAQSVSRVPQKFSRLRALR